MTKVHPLLQGRVGHVFSGDGGNHRNFLFFEKRDGIDYYVTGSGREGISFLHVVANGDRIDVRPVFVGLRADDATADAQSSYVAKAMRLVRHVYFWAGLVAWMTVLGITALVVTGIRRARLPS